MTHRIGNFVNKPFSVLNNPLTDLGMPELPLAFILSPTKVAGIVNKVNEKLKGADPMISLLLATAKDLVPKDLISTFMPYVLAIANAESNLNSLAKNGSAQGLVQILKSTSSRYWPKLDKFINSTAPALPSRIKVLAGTTLDKKIDITQHPEIQTLLVAAVVTDDITSSRTWAHYKDDKLVIDRITNPNILGLIKDRPELFADPSIGMFTFAVLHHINGGGISKSDKPLAHLDNLNSYVESYYSIISNPEYKMMFL